MCNSIRNRITLVGVVLCGVLNFASAAFADSAWPPVQATEQRQSIPVQVGAVTFTTGFYSYFLPIYLVESVNYSKSLQIGPRHYWAIVGLGGDEPIGPQFGSSTAGATPSQLCNSRAARPDVQRNLPPLPPLRDLTALPPLPALPSLPELPPLPALPALEP